MLAGLPQGAGRLIPVELGLLHHGRSRLLRLRPLRFGGVGHLSRPAPGLGEKLGGPILGVVPLSLRLLEELGCVLPITPALLGQLGCLGLSSLGELLGRGTSPVDQLGRFASSCVDGLRRGPLRLRPRRLRLGQCGFRLLPLHLGILDELIGVVASCLEVTGRIFTVEAGLLLDLAGPVLRVLDRGLGAQPGLLDDVIGLGLRLADHLVGEALLLGPLLLRLLQQLVGVLARLFQAASGLLTIPLRILDLGGDLPP